MSPRPSPCRHLSVFLTAVAVLLLAGGAQAGPGEVKLLPADGAAFESFGDAIGLSGDTIVVGAPLQKIGGVESGSAYVFRRTETGWEQEAKLVPPSPDGFDRFGWAVAIRNETVFVGAFGDDDEGSNAGAVYVYDRAGTDWTLTVKLTAADPAEAAEFGGAVAVDADTLIVGADGDRTNGDASGAAYVFVRNAGVWTQQAKLLAADGAVGDEFGFSVDVSMDVAIIGAPLDDDHGNMAGAAYVFHRSSGNWTEATKLLADDGNMGDQFGWSVAAEGTRVVVGAVFAGHGGAYVFHRSGDVWSFEERLSRTVSGGDPSFGHDVDMAGGLIVVGSPGDESGPGGSVWTYTLDGGEWSTITKYVAGDAAAGKQLGVAVATAGGAVAGGAPGDDDSGADAGAAFVFETVMPGQIRPFLLPANLRVKTTKTGKQLTVKGVFDAGPVVVDLSGPGTLRVGERERALPGLTPSANGRSFKYRDDETLLVLKPSRRGTSLTKMKLRMSGEPVDVIDLGEDLVLAYVCGGADAESTLDLLDGRFRIHKSPGGLLSPEFAPEKLKAKLKGEGKDALKLTAWFGLDGPPATAPDFSLTVGDAAPIAVAGTGMTASTGGWSFRGPSPGVKKLVLDYTAGRITLTAKGIDLGAVPEGVSLVTITLGLGAEERAVSVRLFRKGKSLRY